MKNIKRHLDRILPKLQSEIGEIDSKLLPLLRGLSAVKWMSDEDHWKRTVALCRSHAIFDLIYQCPFTRHGFEKPRGYPGDAELLDFIYSGDYQPFVPEITALGARVFPFIINREAPSAVRERRDILARRIDSVCAEIEKPEILSVACGHLRETQLSKHFLAGKTGRFVALDQDGASLAVIKRELAAFDVETVETSIKSLLKNDHNLGAFDFIYAAGLYDYLPDGFAHLFTRRLFEMLKPNGKLLIANFLKGIDDAGYMDVFMDWFLIYRDETEMSNLLRRISPDKIKSRNLFLSENKNIAYLEVRKK